MITDIYIFTRSMRFDYFDTKQPSIVYHRAFVNFNDAYRFYYKMKQEYIIDGYDFVELESSTIFGNKSLPSLRLCRRGVNIELTVKSVTLTSDL